MQQEKASTAVVMVHPDMGIYLGNCLGMGFWSKLDPVGQPAAVCFADEAEARAHIQSWDAPSSDGPNYDEIRFVGVVPDFKDEPVLYASMNACAKAGLDRWDDSISREQNPDHSEPEGAPCVESIPRPQ